MFYIKPLETVSAKLLPKIWQVLLPLLPLAAQYQSNCKEFFDYLCYICGKVIDGPKQDYSGLLKAEIEWIQV